MRAPVSVIIPTLNAEAEFAFCLNGLGEGLEAGLIRELIVSDGGSTDDTLAIAETAGATILSGPPGRGGQLRRGAEAASGDWFLFLHADTRLCSGWTNPVLTHLHSDRAGWFRLAFRADGPMPRLVAAWANLRSRAGLPYGDQGLLIPRHLYLEAGGYPDIPLMEDVALARHLKGRLTALTATAETSAAAYLRDGWLRRGASNLTLLARYLVGADPDRLANHYRR
jgi:rSAM/selenodomain-associated transferase 2